MVPPLKTQGIKTKLVSWILEVVRANVRDTSFQLLEPFCGSCSVGFNALTLNIFKKAVFSDNNPYIIAFYNDLKLRKITSIIIKDYLISEGIQLERFGQLYYNTVRARFNESHSSLDFLFLNRSCFNGLVRFNKQGDFNTPYGHRDTRFTVNRGAYVTKVVNQVKQVEKLLENFDIQFYCLDFSEALFKYSDNSFIYCDPPYFGRKTSYYTDSYSDYDEFILKKRLEGKNFLVSNWSGNPLLDNLWKDFQIVSKEHYYHLGSTREHRHEITEVLIFPERVET